MPNHVVDFPDTYRDIPLPRLLEAYREGPSRLRAVLVGLSEEELDGHLRPGKWSIRENVVHVVDSELVGAVRFRLTYAEPASVLPFYDQDRWAVALRYGAVGEAGIADVLDLFSLLRRTTLPLLEAAAPEEWEREGHHPGHGVLTLRQLLELYADHSEWHVWRILDMREALEKPLDLPMLLPDRLFGEVAALGPGSAG
ncbi:MAG TPA: DinB family protein [Longimicrobiaceae bacterium]|nr:DinB family protein [Longimicrobiaceae bacterium]